MIAFTTTVVSRRVLILATFLVASLLITVSVQAEEECGRIIIQTDTYFPGSEAEFSSILDCTDPFGSKGLLEGFLINNEIVTDGATIVIPPEGIDVYGFQGDDNRNIKSNTFYYKHDAENYISQNVAFRDPLDSELQPYIEKYFNYNQERIDRYTEIYFGDGNTNYFQDEDYNFLIDPNTGRQVLEEYYDLDAYIFSQYVWKRKPLLPGTYTIVYKPQNLDNGPTLGIFDGWFMGVMKYLIPTAYAQEYSEVRTLTFTLVTELSQPSGASNVLFLPGIQASRLYTDGVLGTEDQLWTPNWNQDVRQLQMTESGDSVGQIYTRDILDEVAGLGTVYKNFAHSLDTLVTDKTITEWRPFAYDWRYAVDDIVENGTKYENEIRNALTLVEELSENSYSKKVTIVAHSNGGLLAKALLTRLKEQGKEHLVDRLILLASPQLGTPKAVGSLLHGFDQSAAGGIVIDAAVARSAIKNMPGAYGLLPTAEYFTEVGVPIIKFSEGASLQLFRDHYGTDIDNVSELHNFLTGRGDGRGEAITVYDAIKANSAVLQDSSTLHTNVLQSWRAASTTKVIEVVGVGLPTVSGFEYREFNKRECTTTLFIESCIDVGYYKPVPVFSLYGDETVMAQSAKGYQGNKQTYYFDLLGLRQLGPSNRFKHVNFSEASVIQELVTKSIKNESLDNIPFINTSAVVQTSEYQLLSVNSPATIVVFDGDGNKTEIDFSDDELMARKEGIPNSSIYYMGSTTYIVLPIEKTYNFVITGTGGGGVTVVLDMIGNETLSTVHKVYIPDTIQGMKIEGSIVNEQMSSLEVDLTNDGVLDYMIDPNTGEKIIQKSVQVSKSSSTKTSTKVKNKAVATVAGISTTTNSADLVEYYKKMFSLLLVLQDLLKKYEK